jgi:formylglycine-generating enzyme required for sulfatase activity
MNRPVLLRRWLVFVALSSLIAAGLLLDVSQAQPAKGGKYALVVGVRDYDSGKLDPLPFTENDAEDLATVLTRQGGFVVRVLTTTRGQKNKADAPTVANLHIAIKELLAGKKRDDMLLVGLAGHGIQARVKEDIDKEESFFCPADAQLNDNSTLISLRKLFHDLDVCGASVKLLLVDACRNDPTTGRNANPDTLPRPPRGTAALFSCKAGERAFETDKLGPKGHGVFFHFVLEGLAGKAKNSDGEVTWGGLAEYVTRNVGRTVPKLRGGGAKQTPQEIKNLEGESPVLVSQGKSDLIEESVPDIVNSIGMKLKRIPTPGKFLMGSPKTELGRLADEAQHTVEISQPFYMGIYEVTQEEYRKVIGSNPSYFSPEGGGRDKVKDQSTSTFPVENVSWNDAVTFCDKLSALDRAAGIDRTYRLPTEAEWEYACRAGAKAYTPFNFGAALGSGQPIIFDARYPWGPGAKPTGSHSDQTFPVAQYVNNNPWGLYGMHGNVWEWCSDWNGRE